MLKKCCKCKKLFDISHFEKSEKKNIILKSCKNCFLKAREYIEKNKKRIRHIKKMYKLEMKKTISGVVRKKVSDYKWQDKKRNRRNDLDTEFVKTKLLECNKRCFHCNIECTLCNFAKNDKRQFTLDRICEEYGHLKDNVVVSCLECNMYIRGYRTTERFLKLQKLALEKLNK
jgi:hypothetical protein